MTERTTRDMTTSRKEATGEKQEERPTRIEDPEEPTLPDETRGRGEQPEDAGGGTRPRPATREPRHEQRPEDAVGAGAEGEGEGDDEADRGATGGRHEPQRAGENRREGEDEDR